jgi:hypothetical protein
MQTGFWIFAATCLCAALYAVYDLVRDEYELAPMSIPVLIHPERTT